MEISKNRKIFLKPNEQIGDLTIIRELSINNKFVYECHCVCGSIINVPSYLMNTKKKTHCGCNPKKASKVIFNPGDKKDGLTIIEFEKIGKARGYKCKCDCGNIVTLEAGELNRAKRKSCGCVIRTRVKEKNEALIGKTFNKLTIIGFAPKRKRGIYLKYLCCCGKEGEVSRSCVGTQISCGCVGRSARRTGYKEIMGSYWSGVEQSAKIRNISFNITAKEAWEVYEKQNKKCIFTGRELVFGNPAKKIPQTASLDRIDSDKDYTLDNIQWVHKEVNLAKHILSNDAFIQLCQEVVNHSKMEK